MLATFCLLVLCIDTSAPRNGGRFLPRQTERLPERVVKNGVKQFWAGILKNLKPGVTELYIHASKPTEELKAITNSWKTRAEQYETFTHDPDIRQIVSEEKIMLIGYRPLRDLQRKAKKSSP